MKIVPNQKRIDDLFYNNLLLITALFCMACFVAAVSLQGTTAKKHYTNLQEGSIYGPIKVGNKPQVYRITANFRAENLSTYISGEVLDEDKDTLYEFGKDLWHESGWDSEGYWSESDERMTANLTFSEKGTYYIQFNTEENSIRAISLTVERVKGSYIPHFQAGTLALLLLILLFYRFNQKWTKDMLAALNDKLEEMSDD